MFILLLLLSNFMGPAMGFKLSNQEFLFTDTKAGQRIKFQINPKIGEAIRVQQISDYEYNHMPRASHPQQFQDKMAEVFGGHATSTPERAQRKHVSPHSEAWSLIESGEPRKAKILIDAHASGNVNLLRKVRDSLVHVNNPDHAKAHKELQRTLLLEKMAHALQSNSKEHAFSKITTLGSAESIFKCGYMCSECNAKIDLSRNGPCRVYGCSSDQCQSVAQKLCRDEPDSNSGIACAIEKKPQCRAPCTAAPDPEMKDMDPMDVQAPNFWAKAMSDIGPLKPQVRLYGCVQADISLLELTGVPATIQVGIFGQISWNSGDKCYGWQVDASLGVFFGVKLGGISFGVSINLIGSLSLEEVPYDGTSDETDLENINENMEGNDYEDNRKPQIKGQCPGRRPFALWTAFMDKMYKGLSRDEAIQKRIREAKKRVKSSDGFKAYKNYAVAEPSDNGSAGDPDKGRYILADLPMNPAADTKSFASIKSAGKREVKVFGLTGVANSFRAVSHLAQTIDHKRALYSAHVMKSLTDYKGEPSSPMRKHYEYSNGRYLARHAKGAGQSVAAYVPCYKITRKEFCTTGAAKEFCDWMLTKAGRVCGFKKGAEEIKDWGRMTPKVEDEDDNEGEESKEKAAAAKNTAAAKDIAPPPPSNGEAEVDVASTNTKPRGAPGAGKQFDDRVFNIPRAMRRSFHNENPYFWRNAAISTVNFWVRYIGDLQAIFNLYFAGTPNWEGDCTSLPGRHHLMFEGLTVTANHQTKENSMNNEGKKMEDDEWPWFQRHWMSIKEVGEGKNGKITATDWFEACNMCPRDDIPSIIYPTPICLSIEAKLAEDYMQSDSSDSDSSDSIKVKEESSGGAGSSFVRKEAFAPVLKRFLPGSRPESMKDYIPNFVKAAGGRGPEGVKKGWRGGFLLAFDKTCNVKWGGVQEKYWECEKAGINNIFAATYPRMMERILSMYAKMDRNLELIDVALCEGNTTECKPSKQMVKVLSTQILNDVRLFILSLLNTDEWSHMLESESVTRPREKGLLPTVRQVRDFGPDVFQRTVTGGVVRDMMSDLEKHGYRYALDVKEPKLEKKKFWDTMKKQEEGKVEGEEKGNEHVEEAILLQRQTLRDGKTSKIHRSRNSRSLVNDIVKGKKCKKDSDCDKAECRGSGMFSSGNCGPVAGTLPGKADCEKDVDCESGVCEGNLNGLTTGFCRREHQKFNAPCRRNEECESLMCTGGRFKGEGTCSLPLGTNQEKQQCNFDKECESNFCRGNMHGFTHGFCLKGKQEGGGECDAHRECLSIIGCSKTNNAGTEASPEMNGKLKANGYVGTCYFIERSRMTGESCTDHRECDSQHCKDDKCSDDPRDTILSHTTNFYHGVKQKFGDTILAVKQTANTLLFSKTMDGIDKSVVEEMNEDFATMFGVRVTDLGTPQEVVYLKGDAYSNIDKFGMEIRKDPENFQQAFYDRNIGFEKSNIINNLPAVVDYTITFTLDIESQSPGFCGPSSASLQVIVSKKWIGSTSETASFNKREMCMSLRLAAGKIYFLMDMCYDLPDCKGLQDIDEQSEKQKDGEMIVSDMTIGFNVFQFLEAGSLVDVATKPTIPGFIEVNEVKGEGGGIDGVDGGGDDGGDVVEKISETKEIEFEKKEERMNGPVDNVPAQLPSNEDEVTETAKDMAKGSSMKDIGAKIKRALQDGSLLGSQVIATIFSKKISWAFSQAFIADDDLTNQGDKDFMKYGVSLASAASFFYDAVAASAGFGGNLAEEAKILHPDPADAAKISPVAFKINNELVLEGRGSFKIQKRACSSEEKKEKEKMCSSEVDVKYWGVTKCSDEYCEVGIPVKNPDLKLTFQSWNRAELIITAPPVVLYPTLGLELEFDITQLLYLGVFARRAKIHRKRVDQCLACARAEKGFCDRKWKAVDYKVSDDRCRNVGKEKRKECELQGHAGGEDNGETPRWIITADGCLDMSYPEHPPSKAHFFGNQLFNH